MAEIGLLRFARELVAELRARKAGFAIVGGFAVSVRAEPRFTRDIDLAVSVASDAEAEAITQALQFTGFQVLAVVEQEVAGRLATARLRKAGAGGEPLIADLIFASSGIEPEVVKSATLETIPGMEAIPVATCGDLIALKLLSRNDRTRPNDAADLVSLLSVATPADLEQARRATRLISARGFNRGRDLEKLLEETVLQHASK
jgi:predicted nucleotidyltransferase